MAIQQKAANGIVQQAHLEGMELLSTPTLNRGGMR
jgi:hypothetical protein